MVRAFLNLIVGLLCGVVLLTSAGQAAAQMPRCAQREAMVSILNGNFQESQQAFGFLGPAMLLELFVSDSGSFTIVVTGTDGVSCVLVAGTGWEGLPPAGDGV